MALETGTYISDLVVTNPTSSDAKSQGDDHLRLVKSTLKATFPNVAGAVTPTHLELNYVAGVTSALQAQLNLKAPKDTATFTGNTTLPGTTIIGSVVSQEIAYLSGVTSAIQTQINAKAPTASPTFTGTVTLPATVNSTDAVRKDYADALAFSAVLPAQTGNAGKFVTTNGTTASWAYAGIASVTTAIGMTTLTSSPTLLQITPAAYGIAVTLPDATTCPLGGPLHRIYNAGAYPVRLLNSAGTLIGFVFAGVTSDVSLVNNSTAAGVWDVSNVELVGASAQLLTTLITSVDVCVAIDTNRDFIAGKTGSNSYGVVYNKASNTFGSVTAIRASATANIAAVLSATDQILFVSCSSTTAFEAVTLTISSTTITVNTAATATLSANISAFADGCGLIAVGSSFVTSYTVATPAAQIRALSISGTTVTIGAATALDGNTDGLIVNAGSSIVIAASSVNTNSFYTRPYTVSGSTLSSGTGTTNTGSAVNKFTATGSGRWFLSFYNGGSNFSGGCFVSLIGTTTTVSNTVSYGAASALADAIVITSSKVLILLTSATNNANILTDTAGTASAGTAITLSAATGRACLYATGTDVMVADNTGGNMAQLVSCSGASPIRTKSFKQVSNLATAAFWTASNSVLSKSPNRVTGSRFSQAVRTTSDTEVFSARVRNEVVSFLPAQFDFSGVGNLTNYRGRLESEVWAADASTVITKVECVV